MTPQERARAARNIAITLFAAQSLGSAGIIAAATVAAIIGAELSGRTALAGLPTGVSQLGLAASALLWSLLSERWGRRGSLALGVATGALGAIIAFVAVLQGSFWLVLLGLLVMASASASFNLGRFAAAEVNPPARRGRAVALVVLGGTVGSVVGPTLVAVSGGLAERFGGNALAGPYAVTALLFGLAALVIAGFLRPEPKRLALEVAKAYPQPDLSGAARPLGVLLGQPRIVAAMAAMILGYAVMAMLMGITSLHMLQHDHSLGNISLVFSAHTLGMFAFSVVTGWLIDHWGRYRVIVTGAFVLVAACLLAPLSPQFLPLALALFLLGLGWNFCYVGGSTLLSDQLLPAEKARTQGVNDLLIGLVSGGSSLLSGLLLATGGYGVTSLVGLALSVTLLGVLFWAALRDRREGARLAPVPLVGEPR